MCNMIDERSKINIFDNNRYPEMAWTTVWKVLIALVQYKWGLYVQQTLENCNQLKGLLIDTLNALKSYCKGKIMGKENEGLQKRTVFWLVKSRGGSPPWIIQEVRLCQHEEYPWLQHFMGYLFKNIFKSTPLFLY